MTTKYKLFLDDVRLPHECLSYMHKRIGKDNLIYNEHDWFVARDYHAFIRIIKKYGLPEVVSFDHDLGDEHYLLGNSGYCDWEEYYKDSNRQETGYDCAKWLIEYCRKNNFAIPKCIIHSMNIVGTQNILNILNEKI